MNGIGSDAFALDLGRHDAARPERVRPLAGVMVARPLRGARRDAERKAGTASPFPARSPPGRRCRPASASLPFDALLRAGRRRTRARGSSCRPSWRGQWQAQVPRLGSQPGFAEAFLRNGRAPTAGERFRFPEQARDARGDRRHDRRVVLSRSPGRDDRRLRERRGADGRRPRQRISPTGSSPPRSRIAVTACTRSRQTARGSRH